MRVDAAEWHLQRIVEIASSVDTRRMRERDTGEADDATIDDIAGVVDPGAEYIQDVARRAQAALDALAKRRDA